MPTTINIYTLINTPNAILHKFGMEVYESVKPCLRAANPVVLDFNGLRNITSGFFHASTGNMVREFGEQFFELVTIIGLEGNSDWEEKYQDSIELAQNPERARKIDWAIAELFED